MIVIATCVLMAYLSSTRRYQLTPDTCDNAACDNDPVLCPGRMVCPPESWEIFQIIDFICCILYGIDLALRLMISPMISSRILRIIPTWWDEIERKKPRAEQCEEPSYGPLQKLARYWLLPGNIIDTLSTLPFFIIIGVHQAQYVGYLPPWQFSSSNSAILTVRIARCFRLLKVLDVHPQGSPKLSIIISTVRESASSLFIMLGFVAISAVIFGSLVYTCEKGDFTVTIAYPDGAFLRKDVTGDGTLEVTPFDNLGACVYWSVVTMTTLGYGDLYPTSNVGRLIGGLCSVYGILVISLPVTIIGNAFSTEMETYQAGVIAEKQRIRRKKISDTMFKLSKKAKEVVRDNNVTTVASEEEDEELIDHDLAFPEAIKISRIHNSRKINDTVIENLWCSSVIVSPAKAAQTSTKSTASATQPGFSPLPTSSSSSDAGDGGGKVGVSSSSAGASSGTFAGIVKGAIQASATGNTTAGGADSSMDDILSKDDVQYQRGLGSYGHNTTDGIAIDMATTDTASGVYNQTEIAEMTAKLVAAKRAIQALEGMLYK
jgi:hypothetical protein